MTSSIPKEPRSMAIGLGANLPSKAGNPASTLIKVRPLIETIISEWLKDSLNTPPEISDNEFRFRWSPLFETNPIGGPKNQPKYINAVLVVDGECLEKTTPSEKLAMKLLTRFLKLEKLFGRERSVGQIPWGPRTIDIDLLAWGGLQIKQKNLTLPHPRLIERNFVVVPLGEALNIGTQSPRRIKPQAGWE